MSDSENPKDNRLLAALADTDWQRWKPQLERVDLKLGQVLYEPGCAQRHAYFPTSAIVSLVHVLNGGGSTEVAVVGNEGTEAMLSSTSKQLTTDVLSTTSTTAYLTVADVGSWPSLDNVVERRFAKRDIADARRDGGEHTTGRQREYAAFGCSRSAGTLPRPVMATCE